METQLHFSPDVGPIIVAADPRGGRRILAARDLMPSDVVTNTEAPLVAGPTAAPAGIDTCVGCLGEGGGHRCLTCGLTLCRNCGTESDKSPFLHLREECFKYSKAINRISRKVLSATVAPYRYVTKRASFASRAPFFARWSFALSAEEEEIMCALTNLLDANEAEAREAVCVLRVNAISVAEGRGSALFSAFLALNHLCQPNCQEDEADALQLKVLATHAI